MQGVGVFPERDEAGLDACNGCFVRQPETDRAQPLCQLSELGCFCVIGVEFCLVEVLIGGNEW